MFCVELCLSVARRPIVVIVVGRRQICYRRLFAVSCMRKILSVCAVRTAKCLGLVTLMSAVALLPSGKLSFLGALVVGYLLATVYFFTIGTRLFRIVSKAKKNAKREMLFGLLLRMVMIFVALTSAIKFSLEVFFTLVAGFAVCYALILANLTLCSMKMKIFNEDGDSPPSL